MKLVESHAFVTYGNIPYSSRGCNLDEVGGAKRGGGRWEGSWRLATDRYNIGAITVTPQSFGGESTAGRVFA